MTDSEHRYTAAVIGSPDLPLSVQGGRITLDIANAPHVDAELTITTPAAAALEALDPRQGARVRVDVAAEFPAGPQARSFDLGLRRRPVRLSSSTTSISLASDEALLTDYKPLADDPTPFALASSLRDVINYVLGTALPGSSLEASPALDVDMTPYWELVNYAPNPSVVGSIGTYYVGGANASNIEVNTAGGGMFGDSAAAWVSNAAGTSWISARQYTANPGEHWNVSAYTRQINNRPTWVFVRFRDSEKELIEEVVGAQVPTSSAWGAARPFVHAVAPPGTARIGVGIAFDADQSGRGCRMDGLLVAQTPHLTEYFDGSNTPAGYTTSWEATPHQSQSIRTPDAERDPEAFIWRAGTSALDFLVPLVQSVGLRLVCDEGRAWTLRDEHFLAAGSLSIRQAVNLIDVTDTISRDDGDWYDAATTEYVWTDGSGLERRRVDAYAMTVPHTRVAHFERSTPFPGAGFSEYAVRRAQARGRVIEASKVSDWTVHAETPCQFVIDDAPTQTGKVDRIAFDLDRDEMTVTARTADTPAAAWILIPVGETWNDQPPGETWMDEVI